VFLKTFFFSKYTSYFCHMPATSDLLSIYESMPTLPLIHQTTKNFKALNRTRNIFGPVTPQILMCICISFDCMKAKRASALVFNRYSPGVSTIAILYVSKKCTVGFAYARRATRWALHNFLVSLSSFLVS